MRKYLFVIIILLSVFGATAQIQIPDFKRNVTIKDSDDSLIRANFKFYNLIIAFRNYSYWSGNYKSYHILLLNGSKWQTMTLLINKSKTAMLYSLVKIRRRKEFSTGDVAFNQLVEKGLFEIEGDDVYSNCPPKDTVINGKTIVVTHSIDDAGEYSFYIITPKKSRHLNFYAPDFFAEYCPLFGDRKRFLELLKVLYKN